MIRIGTRGSKLALWQANNLKDQLSSIDVVSELVIIKTKGDLIQHLSFDKIEGKGFFTKEIEDALLNDEIDIAVHSLKDLPTVMPEGLSIAGLSSRANPCDVLLIHPNHVNEDRLLKIKENSTIGTSSIRRKVQLRAFDSSIELVDIRGNVPTRVQKVRDGHVHAIVLASAGLDRLQIDLSDLKVIRFNPLEFVPAPAQGVVGYQCRTSDKATRLIVQNIHQKAVANCTNVERKVLNLLDGGCQLPLGAYCTVDQNHNFHCTAILGGQVDDPIKHASLSQSTSVGLAEKIVSILTE